MINNIKALILLLPILFGVFFVARFVFKNIVEPRRIDMWRNIFLTITTIGFLVPNFWIFILILTVVLVGVVLLRLEKNLAALFMLLICALPPQEQPIPGFAGINQLFPISPPLLVSITVLLAGLFYTERIFRKTKGASVTDFFMIGFVVLSTVLAFRDTSFTDGLRGFWIVFLTTFLPYFVISRWSRSMDEIRVVCVAFLVPVLALSGVALLEPIFKWHFYAMPALNWHGPVASPYVFRSGILRVYASLIGPLEFGFVLVLAVSMALAVMSSKISKSLGFAGLGGFAGALLFTFSRGPWLGAIVTSASFVATGPKGFIRSLAMGIAGVILFGVLLVSPLGPKLIEALPFVGERTEDGDGTIDYRKRLFVNGTEVIMERPLFGSTTFFEHPKMIELTQGQGIIDLVNSYIQVALAKGLVGLFFFAGILLTATWAAFRAMGMTKRDDPEMSAYARAFFSAMVAIIVVIGTTSSNPPLPILYFMMAGLCVSIRRLAQEQHDAGFVEVAAGAQASSAQGLSQSGPSPSQSIRAAKQAREEDGRIDAEAAALIKRNAEKKRQLKTRDVPAHLRQYIPRGDDDPSNTDPSSNDPSS